MSGVCALPYPPLAPLRPTSLCQIACSFRARPQDCALRPDRAFTALQFCFVIWVQRRLPAFLPSPCPNGDPQGRDPSTSGSRATFFARRVFC